MKETFIKVNIDDDNQLDSIEIAGTTIDLAYIASIAVRTISEKTGNSIECVSDDIKLATLLSEATLNKKQF